MSDRHFLYTLTCLWRDDGQYPCPQLRVLLGYRMPKLDCQRPDNLPGAVNQPLCTLFPVAIKERHAPYGDLDQDECLVQTASSQPCLLSLGSVAGDKLLLRLLDASLAIDRVPPPKVGQELANV